MSYLLRMQRESLCMHSCRDRNRDFMRSYVADVKLDVVVTSKEVFGHYQ